MPVKDKVVGWWIQNIIIPRQEIIDRPGFVVTTFTEKKFTTYLRDFFLPEELFEIIEKNIVETYSDKGSQLLYSIGKKFGYIFSSMSNFTTIKNSSAEEMEKFAYNLVRYIEGTYAQKAEHELNIEQKKFSIFFDNYIICRHNGLGHILTEGGISGIWSYVMQDKIIEGIQLQCQGRGSHRCKVICGQIEEISRLSNKFYVENDLIDLKCDVTYKSLNEIRKTNYCKNSLKDLLNAGFFRFKNGILSYKDNRFFHTDTHLLYILDQMIAKMPEGEDKLFQSAFEYGKKLYSSYGGRNYQEFITDFFSALGFGDVFITNYSNTFKISFIYYPWTVLSKDSKYICLRGLISGILSSGTGKNIKLMKSQITVSNYLTVTISE